LCFPVTIGTTKRISNIKFENISFYEESAGNYGINIRDIDGLVFEGCDYIGKYKQGVTGNGIVIAGTWDSLGDAVPAGLGPNYYDMPVAETYCTGVRFSNCNIENTAVQLVACKGVTVDNCTFTDGHYSLLIDFLNAHVKVTGCEFRATQAEYQSFVAAPESAIYVGQGSRNVEINNCKFLERHTNIYIESARRVTVSDCIMTATTGNASMWLITETLFGTVLGSSEIDFRGNYVQGYIYGALCGTVANESKGVKIVDNYVELLDVAAASLAVVYNVQDFMIANNSVKDGKIAEIYSASNGDVLDNNCDLSTDRIGIYFDATRS
jgi:hypothetical protein